VVLLFATGLYGLGREVASPDALLTTPYGRTLLAKIGLVLAMGVIGLLNAALLHPYRVAAPLARLLGRPQGWSPLPRRRLPDLIRLDIGLALLVLLLTGLLTSEAPPRGFEFNVAPENIRQEQSKQVDDLTVALSVKPNRPGQNVLTIFAGSTRRPPPAEIMRVIVRFTYQGRDLGPVSLPAQEVERGRFVVGGSHMSLVGPWQIDVVVRRRGLEDSVVQFGWVVPPVSGMTPTILSKQRLETAADIAAGVILMALVLGIAAALRPGRPRISDADGQLAAPQADPVPHARGRVPEGLHGRRARWRPRTNVGLFGKRDL
jgi:copper transport protein